MGFEEVRDALVGSIAPELGEARTSAHRGGLKVWFGDTKREHYEAQLIRLDGDVVLEIGFHAEHTKPAENDAALDVLARRGEGLATRPRHGADHRALPRPAGLDTGLGDLAGAAASTTSTR